MCSIMKHRSILEALILVILSKKNKIPSFWSWWFCMVQYFRNCMSDIFSFQVRYWFQKSAISNFGNIVNLLNYYKQYNCILRQKVIHYIQKRGASSFLINPTELDRYVINKQGCILSGYKSTLQLAFMQFFYSRTLFSLFLFWIILHMISMEGFSSFYFYIYNLNFKKKSSGKTFHF